MKEFKVTVLFFVLLALATAQSTLNCLQFLNELQQEYNTSRAQCTFTIIQLPKLWLLTCCSQVRSSMIWASLSAARNSQ